MGRFRVIINLITVAWACAFLPSCSCAQPVINRADVRSFKLVPQAGRLQFASHIGSFAADISRLPSFESIQNLHVSPRGELSVEDSGRFEAFIREARALVEQKISRPAAAPTEVAAGKTVQLALIQPEMAARIIGGLQAAYSGREATAVEQDAASALLRITENYPSHWAIDEDSTRALARLKADIPHLLDRLKGPEDAGLEADAPSNDEVLAPRQARFHPNGLTPVPHPNSDPSAADKKISIESAKRLLMLERPHQIPILEQLFLKRMKEDPDIALASLETLAMDSNLEVRRAATTALGSVYAAKINRGKEVSLAPLEALAKDSDPYARHTAITALGAVYAAKINQGQDVSLALLEALAKDSDPDIRREAVTALGTVYTAKINQGQDVSLALLEALAKDSNQYTRQTAITALGAVYATKINQGKDISLAWLEALAKDSNQYNRHAAISALGTVYAAKINRGKDTSLALLEASAKGSSHFIRIAAVTALETVYAAKIDQGEDVSLALLEALAKDSDLYSRHAAVVALGTVYAAKTNQAKDISLVLLKALTKDLNWEIRHAAVAALGTVYATQINRGEDVTIAWLEALAKDSDPAVRLAASCALGTAFAARIKQGNDIALESLETLAKDSFPLIHQAAITALGTVYAAKISRGIDVSLTELETMASRLTSDAKTAIKDIPAICSTLIELKRFFLLGPEQKKHELWFAHNLPYEESIVEKFLAATDGVAFIRELKARAERLLQDGFDPASSEQAWLAFLAVRMHGIEVSHQEFKERLSTLVQFDQEHPGSFQRLFSKPQSLPALVVSGHALQALHGDIQTSVLDRNREALLAAERRILGLEWMEKDFQGQKAFTLQNLYYQLKKQQAVQQGKLRDGERFRVDFPSPERMRQELLEDRKSYIKIAFELARQRLGDRTISDKAVVLMRDLIITDALSDPGIMRGLASQDIETKIAAFKNLYGDYKNHLPDSVGVKIGAVKGLAESLEGFSKEVDAELAKVRQAAGKSEPNTYRLVPQGFLSVFRGRCGISDCSFDQDKGMPYTRAMHEDTIYYGVYKGNRPKGYVGMLVARTTDGRKVLTIDTVNSPSLDGEELLTDLFKTLGGLAKRLGCIGIALPENVGPSFNFDNEKTIQSMAVYRKTAEIRVKPVHAESWNEFTKRYGADRYNSIEDGRFRLLE